MSMHTIKNVKIYDGSGASPRLGHVIWKDGVIQNILSFHDALPSDCHIVEGNNLCLAPGFIDVHAHSDLTLLAAPDAYGKISQGITTEISGNCGQSFFPVTAQNREHVERLAGAYGIKVTWDTYAEYEKTLERAKPAINFNCLCGHGTLRASVMGYEKKEASADDIKAMRESLKQMLQDGCPGISTGLIYVPGRFASMSELEQVFSIMKECGGIYATHMRSEGDNILEALDEALHLAQCGSGRLEISHIKTALPRNWHKLDEVVEKIEHARKTGLQVTADRYPYTFSQTSLSVLLDWEPYASMTDAAIQKLLSAVPAACKECTTRLENESPEKWDKVILSFTTLPEYKKYLGLSLTELGRLFSSSPAETVMDILQRDAARAQGAFGGLSPNNLKRILAKPWVCCGTDENARPADESQGRCHPRGFGSFPLFLNMASGQTSMAEAVRKVTSLPSEIFHLAGRGKILPGYAADFVLFDENTLAPGSTWAAPHTPAKGIRSVWVNGVLSYDGGKVIAHAGQLCRLETY